MQTFFLKMKKEKVSKSIGINFERRVSIKGSLLDGIIYKLGESVFMMVLSMLTVFSITSYIVF